VLAVRIATAVIGAPLVLFCLISGSPHLVFLLLAICLTLSVSEATKMLLPKLEYLLVPHPSPDNSADVEKLRHLRRLTFVSIGLSWIIFTLSAAGPQGGARGLIVCGLLGAIVLASFLTDDVDQAMAQLFGLLFAVCYGALPWIAVWDLSLMGPQSRFVLLMLAIVWAGDTAAYFVGRALGGRIFGSVKLSPHRSPNKTWEGAIGGLAASVAAGVALNYLAFAGELGSLHLIIITCLFGGIAGQAGDLLESTMKRFARVKDSGDLLPGHGGFLDRVDGILFAAPACWTILFFLQG
jgi:phosphatidate cytidylyltransferase